MYLIQILIFKCKYLSIGPTYSRNQNKFKIFNQFYIRLSDFRVKSYLSLKISRLPVLKVGSSGIHQFAKSFSKQHVGFRLLEERKYVLLIFSFSKYHDLVIIQIEI